MSTLSLAFYIFGSLFLFFIWIKGDLKYIFLLLQELVGIFYLSNDLEKKITNEFMTWHLKTLGLGDSSCQKIIQGFFGKK
jgi:hypothetical protein